MRFLPLQQLLHWSHLVSQLVSSWPAQSCDRSQQWKTEGVQQPVIIKAIKGQEAINKMIMWCIYVSKRQNVYCVPELHQNVSSLQVKPLFNWVAIFYVIYTIYKHWLHSVGDSRTSHLLPYTKWAKMVKMRWGEWGCVQQSVHNA